MIKKLFSRWLYEKVCKWHLKRYIRKQRQALKRELVGQLNEALREFDVKIKEVFSEMFTCDNKKEIE